MARYHYQSRRDAERRYSHHVDIPVPEGGLGKQLNEMIAWCGVRFTDWTHAGVTLPERDDRGHYRTVAGDAGTGEPGARAPQWRRGRIRSATRRVSR